MLEKYFNNANSFKVFYSAYINGSKEYEENFEKASNYIQSLEFYKFLAKPKKKPEDLEKVVEALKNLNKSVEAMLYNLAENNILPKPIKKKKYDPKKALDTTY
ncbi:MAG: hypothetical protein R6U15_00025 [Candidatus Izemoplasmatales bacterium]